MGLQNFNIVLVGSNFPVTAIDLGDFGDFRHRKLRELVRLPVVLQAEGRGMQMTILTERFEAAVTGPSDTPSDARQLVQIAEAFFQYVGPRSLTATGHNMQFTIEGTADRKDDVRHALVAIDRAQALVGHELVGADASVFFRLDPESVTRMTFATMTEGDVTVDVNVNYDRNDLSAAEAVKRLPKNLAALEVIADNLGTELIGKVTS
jgi:hypothetical protein